MPEVSKEVIALLGFLMPGFVAAWVFYALTNYQKPSQFERVAQALVFTVVIRAIVYLEEVVALFLGNFFRKLGTWTVEVELLASVATALFIGVSFSWASNSDWIHSKFRKWNITKRSAEPSEWCGVLSAYQRYVVLVLADERRVMGWPKVFPSSPESGHFFLMDASWLAADGGEQRMEAEEGVLVNIKDVKFVHILK